MYLGDRPYLSLTTGGILAALIIFTPIKSVFPFWVIAAGMSIANTIFHEIGHTIAAWIFGMPAIPAVFTLFGREHAGGISMMLDRSWIMQAIAMVVLFYGCYWLWRNIFGLFYYGLAFTFLVALVAFTPYYMLVVNYMGHGGSILMGGYLLFRVWAEFGIFNKVERWLSGFFGFFLILYNIRFACSIVFDPFERARYNGHTTNLIGHNDFVKMVHSVPGWSVEGIAIFTIGFGVAALIIPPLIASYMAGRDW